MSSETDRIAVPTNGRGPHPVPETTGTTDADDLSDSTPSDVDLSNALSPKQLAVGFGVIASLVLLAVARARRRRTGG